MMIKPLLLLLHNQFFGLPGHYFSLQTLQASFLFSSCERLSIASTCMPDGKCTPRAAVSTLLTFCPPGPDARQVSNFTSVSLQTGSSLTGKTFTPTNQFLRL
jgi:hypothetical protein